MEDIEIKDLILEFLFTHTQDFYNIDNFKEKIPHLSKLKYEVLKPCLDEMLDDGYIEHPENEPHSYYRISTKGMRFYKQGGYKSEEEKRKLKLIEDQQAEVKRQEREELEDTKLRLEVKQLYRDRRVWIPTVLLLLGNLVQLAINFWK